MFSFLSDLLRWFGQGLPTTARTSYRQRLFVEKSRTACCTVPTCPASSGRVIRNAESMNSIPHSAFVQGRNSPARTGGLPTLRADPTRGTPPARLAGSAPSLGRSVNHRGPPSMSRRAGYPWTEQMSRKMLRNVEKRGVQAARLAIEPGGTGSKLSYRSHGAQRSGKRDRTGSSHTCLRLIAAGRKLGSFCLPDSALISPKLRSAND